MSVIRNLLYLFLGFIRNVSYKQVNWLHFRTVGVRCPRGSRILLHCAAYINTWPVLGPRALFCIIRSSTDESHTFPPFDKGGIAVISCDD